MTRPAKRTNGRVRRRRPRPVDQSEPAEPARKLGKFDRPKHPRDWRFFVGGLGKVLIAIGLMMFGFVAYQLWGTGIETARAQNSLESEFDELLAGTTPASRPPRQPRRSTPFPTDTVPVGQRPVDTVPADTVPVVDRGARRGAGASVVHRGRRAAATRDPPDRRRLDRGGRGREIRPEEGPRPLSRDAAARPARQRRDRRPPHHLRPAVLQHRAASAGRRDHHHHPERPVRLHRHRASRSCRPTTTR